MVAMDCHPISDEICSRGPSSAKGRLTRPTARCCLSTTIPKTHHRGLRQAGAAPWGDASDAVQHAPDTRRTSSATWH